MQTQQTNRCKAKQKKEQNHRYFCCNAAFCRMKKKKKKKEKLNPSRIKNNSFTQQTPPSQLSQRL